MKPVILPMRGDRYECGFLEAGALAGLPPEHTLVVAWHHLEECSAVRLPRIQNPCAVRAVRPRDVAADQIEHERDILRLDERLEINHARIATLGKPSVHVEHVGHAAAHPGGEIATRPAEYDDASRSHVLAAVIADAFDHRVRPAVPNGESFAGQTA